MKNEMVGDKRLDGKVEVISAVLPWWARVRIAYHARTSLPASRSHHIRHCSDCGGVLISTSAACLYSYDLCCDCSRNKKNVAADLGSKIASHWNPGCQGLNVNQRTSQGGN